MSKVKMMRNVIDLPVSKVDFKLTSCGINNLPLNLNQSSIFIAFFVLLRSLPDVFSRKILFKFFDIFLKRAIELFEIMLEEAVVIAKAI